MILVTSAMLLVVTHASGQPDARIDRARGLFEQGAAHAAEDRWEQALRAFQASSALLAHAGTTYNIGYCERGLGHYTRARAQFASALAEHQARGEELSAAQQEAAAAYHREADAAIARLTVTLEPGDSKLRVDARPLQREGDHQVAGVAAYGAPASVSSVFVLHVDPGQRVFELTDGVHSEERVITVKRGEQRAIALTVTASDAFVPIDPALVRREDLRMTRLGWAIGLGGAGLAFGVAGGVLAGVAAGTWSDAQAACPQLTRCDDDRGFELSNRARFEARLGTTAWVTAGAALAGGVVLWLSVPDSLASAEPDVAIRVAPAGFGVVGRF